MRRADASLFRMDVSGFSPETFVPLSFEAFEAVSEPGWLRVEVRSDRCGLGYGELIGKEVVLSLLLDGGHEFRGVVSEFHEEPGGDGRSRYAIVARDRLALLGEGGRCRVFRERSAPEIIEAVLVGCGIAGRRLRSRLRRSYPPIALCVQYNESDLDFFRRVARAAGIFHFCAPEAGDVVLTLADDNSAFPRSLQLEEMEHRPQDGLTGERLSELSSLRRSGMSHVARVRLLGYDYAAPQALVRGLAEGDGSGELVRHDAGLDSSSRADEMCLFHRESCLSLRERVHAVSCNPRLRAGSVFAIARGCGSGLGGRYLLLEARHRASQEGSTTGCGDDLRYRNEIVCQPVGVPYRDAPLASPRIPGVIVAKVDAPEGAYAHLDGQGRYRARFPFDEGDPSAGEASPPIRMAQPGVGPGHGLHLPVHGGADLVLAFEGGDIDRPIALGAVPDPSRASPVTASNRTRSILRSAAGNLLEMDDLEGGTRALLASSGGRRLSLDDAREQAGILLESARGHRLRLSDREGILELASGDGKLSLRIEEADGVFVVATGSGHVLRLSDAARRVALRSAQGHEIVLDDAEGILEMREREGLNRVRIEAGGGVLVSSGGDLELSARGALNLKGGTVRVEATEGNASVIASGALGLEGQDVSASAGGRLSLDSGAKAVLKAGTGLRLEAGLDLESCAGASHKASGVAVNLEAVGVCAVKGALVTLN